MSNSFLPEDYLAKRAERRTNIISLALFAVVMTAVFGAFLVTNRQWSQIKVEQAAINVRYQDAALQIKELNELEKQREDMLNKAELASSLVERVPRSILLAELINRMPQQLGVLEFELESEQRQPERTTVNRQNNSARLSGAERAKSREEAKETIAKVEAPQYDVHLALVGAAPTDLEVSRFLSELTSYPLIRDVTLEYSEEKEIQGLMMRQFRISMALAHDADVRMVQPLTLPRGLRNPMSDELMLNPDGARSSVDSQ